MSVNRYNLPANQPIIDTYAPMPFKEMLLAGQSMQKQKDDLEAQRLELMDKEVYSLSPDDERVKKKKDYYDTQLDALAGLYGTDLRKAKQEYAKLSRDMKKDWSQYGEIGSAMNNYSKFNTWWGEEKKRLEKEDVSADMIEKAKQYHLKKYAEQGGIGDDPTNYKSIALENLANKQDLSEWAMKNADMIKASVGAYANVNFGGLDENGVPQYIFTDKGTDETISPQKIQATLMQLAAGSDDIRNYIQQGMKMGYTSEQILANAIGGAMTGMSYTKATRDKDIKGNPTYEHATNKIQEAANNIPLIVATPEEIIENETTKRADAGIYTKGVELMKVVTDSYNQDIISLERELFKLETGDFSNETKESRDGRVANINIIKENLEKAKNEQAKFKTIQESFVKNAYGVNEEKLLRAGIKDGEELLNYTQEFISASDKVFNTKAEVKYRTDEAVKEMETNLENVNADIRLIQNSDGSYSLYDTDNRKVLSPETTGEESYMLDGYAEAFTHINNLNSYIRESNNKVNQQITSLNNSPITNLYGKVSTVDGLENTYNSVRKSKEQADVSSNNYLENKTATSTSFVFNKDQVKNSPYLSKFEGLLNTNRFKFTKKYSKGAYSEYTDKPFKMNPYTGAITPYDKTKNLQSIDIKPNGNIVISATNVDNELLESTFDITKGTTANNIIYQMGKEMLINSGGDPELVGNAYQLMAASGDNTYKAYQEYIKQKQDLVGVNPSNSSGLIASSPVSLVPSTKMNLIISKDYRTDADGKVYNIYVGQGINKNDLQNVSKGDYKRVSEAELDAHVAKLIVELNN